MQITNFDHIKLGSGFPAQLEIRKIGCHEQDGIYAEAYTYRYQWETNYVQLRKHPKDPICALFSFKNDKIEIEGYWKDSIVIWDSRSELK